MPLAKISLPLLTLAVCLVGGDLHAANSITPQRVRLDTPLSEEEARKIQALKSWPLTPFDIEPEASDAVLASLEKVPELRRVTVSSRRQATPDLAALARLKSLAELRSRDHAPGAPSAVSCRPLAANRELRVLALSGWKLTEVDSLGECARLTELELRNCDLDSLDFMKRTPEIVTLNLSGATHTFSSYEPLAGLGRLMTLDLGNNPQARDRELGALAKLERLVEVRLDATPVTHLEFLAGSAGLERIWLRGCRALSELRGLEKHSALVEVWADKSGLTQIAALAGKPALERVVISDTAVADISPLRDARSLRSLSARGTRIADLSALGGLTRLDEIDLADSRVGDLSPLRGARALRNLDLAGTAAADLAPLSGLDRLERLNLERTAVRNLRALHGLASLRHVRLTRAAVDEAEIQALRAAQPLALIEAR